MISKWPVILSLILGGFFPSVLRAQAAPPDQAIAEAIAKGIRYVKEQQQPQGNWEFTFNHNHDLGMTALAGLALLENGLDQSDPSVAAAHEVVKGMSVRSNQTYDLALAILFLARVNGSQSAKNDALIKRLANRLVNGEQRGMWTYTVPLQDENEVDDNPGISRRRQRLRRIPFFGGAGDNSNTQFALLGVWAAGRHGFAPDQALEAIDEHFRTTEGSDGHWGYIPGAPAGEAMTCAGLMGLAIGASRPGLAERQTARSRGAALAANPAFVSALKAVTNDARQLGPQSEIYYLWSLERVCVALGLRQLADFDWYAAGARQLLNRQNEDGSWPEERWGSLPNSCLALLFLRKANLAFELDRVLRLPSEPGIAKISTDSSPVAQDEELAKAEVNQPAGVKAGPDDEAGVVITSASQANFPEITVEFEVKRPDQSYVLDGKVEDFRVTEYGQTVPILSLQSPLTTEAHPTTVVLVVDRSLSMEEENRIGHLKRAVGTFLKGLPRASRVAVVSFGSEVELLCPFTGDFEKVQQAVDTLKPGGATRYYDAVAEALELLQKETGRRAVLALTDGEDTFSQTANLPNVIAMANRLGLPVHTLGLGTEDEIESDALKHLARATRGQYYPAKDAAQLRSIYEQIARRLSSSYTLVYKTDRKLPDGTLRPVRVSYRASRKVGETAVFIHGMVVPAAGWSRLFLLIVAVLIVLGLVPSRLRKNANA